MSAVVWVAVISIAVLLAQSANALRKANEQGRQRGWWV